MTKVGQGAFKDDVPRTNWMRRPAASTSSRRRRSRRTAKLDLESTDRLVDFYIEKGVSGITVLGMMGEAQKMAAEESEAFL